jgi:hypothetical protein
MAVPFLYTAFTGNLPDRRLWTPFLDERPEVQGVDDLAGTIRYGPREVALVAGLNAAMLREQRLLWTRRLVIATLPGWVQAFTPRLPVIVAWAASLVVLVCAAMVVVHAILERRSRARAARAVGEPLVRIHGRRMVWPDLGSGLWSALGSMFPAPWAVLALRWRMPAPLLMDLATPLLLVLAAAIFNDVVRRRA